MRAVLRLRRGSRLQARTWPARPCAATLTCAGTGAASGLSAVNSSPFERPGAVSRGVRLRPGFFGPAQCGPVARVNPQTSALLSACGRVNRRSAATVDHKNRIRNLD